MNNFFDKLFGKKTAKTTKTTVSENIVTAPLSDAQLQAIKVASSKLEPAQILVGCGQSVGKQRELNEDSLLAFTSTIAGNFGTAPLGLYIVADGMGGHQYGEVASNSAVRTIAGHIMKKFLPYLYNLPPTPLDESLQEIMHSAITEAQRVVLREAPGSGTTVSAALVVGQQVTFAHVGDSRGYLIYQDGRMEQVTRDHSLVRRLEELGQITSSEAAVHPQRNVLYKALGQGEVLEADITTMPFPQNGYILLCSDGLWGAVPDEDLRQITLNAPSIQQACQNMVSAANAAGGPDNITAVLVQMLS